MVITMLYHRIKQLKLPVANEAPSTPASRNASIDSSLTYLRGEYKIITRLCQVLDHGLRAKNLTDECIDACAHLQNLREAIYDYKRKVEADPSNPNAHELSNRGLHYLLRYFYLIVFAEFLLEELHESGNGKILKVSFLHWISERREITNLTLPERGDLNFN